MGPYGRACLKHHVLSVQAGCGTHLNYVGISNKALSCRIPSACFRGSFMALEFEEVTEFKNFMIAETFTVFCIDFTLCLNQLYVAYFD